MGRKFAITNEIKMWKGHVLHRISAVRDFADVKVGDLGGWIEDELNLGANGDCWIYGDAKVYGRAKVYGNAKVLGNAEVMDCANVHGNANVGGSARIGDSADILGDARIMGGTAIRGTAKIGGRMYVDGWNVFITDGDLSVLNKPENADCHFDDDGGCLCLNLPDGGVTDEDIEILKKGMTDMITLPCQDVSSCLQAEADKNGK